ncbi:unnamed protein product [Absidia cylindrospora]
MYMSTSQEAIAGTEQLQDEVIARRNLGTCQLTLNRTSKMNALSFNMLRAITPELTAWEKSDLAKNIIVKSEPGAAFCAGGDVKVVFGYGMDGDYKKAAQFFREQYQMDHIISTLDTPYIALIDGVTMGGGVGLSAHAAFRVATENTLFAMPETRIGFFPDVGGSFFLPRLDGQLGIYLGLTGKRLKAVDVFYAGVATHYVPSANLPALEARLAELETSSHDDVNGVIEEFSSEIHQEAPYSLGGGIRAAIDRCFKYNTMEEIIDAVQKEQDTNPVWAKETLKSLNTMSPTSLKVSLRSLRRGGDLTIAQCFQMEFQLLQKFLRSHDVYEGVHKTMVVRGQPAEWQPPTLDQVDDQAILADYFDAPSPESLAMVSPKDFTHYPHRHYALPSEDDIRKVVTGEAADVGNFAMMHDEIIDYLVRAYNGKQGVKEKVAEVLSRKTRIMEHQDGHTLKWID